MDRQGSRARSRAVVGFVALGVWWGAWGALLPAVQRSAGVNDSALGGALLLIGAGALASMRLTGYLVDRFGRAVLPLSVASLGVGGILPALVDGALPLAATMAAVGISSGAFDVAVNAEASCVEAGTQRPLMSLGHAGFSFGVIFGSLGAGALRTGDVSLPGALGAFGVVLLVVAGALAAGTDRLPRTPSADEDEVGRWRWWWPPRALAGLGGLLALSFLVESAWQTWSAVHLERDLGASVGLAAAGPAVFGASAGLGRLLVHRWAMPGREGRVVSAGALLAAGATVAAALLPSVPLVLGAIGLVGLGTAACAPSLLSVAGRSAAQGRAGAAVGTVTTVGYLGFVLAPAVVGGLAGAFTLPVALAGIAVVALTLAGCAAFLRSPPPDPCDDGNEDDGRS